MEIDFNKWEKQLNEEMQGAQRNLQQAQQTVLRIEGAQMNLQRMKQEIEQGESKN